MDNKGQVTIILGIMGAIIGVIVLASTLPLMNDFLDSTIALVDDPTAIALGLVPVMIVVALIVRLIQTFRGDRISLG